MATTDAVAPLEDVAAALRRIMDLLLRVDDDPALGHITSELHAMSDLLEAEFGDERPFDKMLRSDAPRHDPVSGVENAIAPPMTVEVDEDGTASGEVVFGLPYQGPKGLLHGGISALFLDHVLSLANSTSRGVDSGFLVTAELSLRYHRPVPLFEPAVVSARQTSVEGRKVRAAGEISVNGEVAVSAEGLFIATKIRPAEASADEGGL
ncbi:PaaI family thioesterase [Rhodococcus opacus]|uniref:PaaI family thioesterase n=1 Tax=Rhodococcus opacus TaxID=37919 RepID=UPI001C4610EC|nr:PaaI family thioesterase [Rhodococcus opacus]MBV6756233.1 PaaI family thioesterase [Rhodococcus opacus]